MRHEDTNIRIKNKKEDDPKNKKIETEEYLPGEQEGRYLDKGEDGWKHDGSFQNCEEMEAETSKLGKRQQGQDNRGANHE